MALITENSTSTTAFRAILNWVFHGTEVYLLAAPQDILKTVKINWDRGTTDVQHADGKVLRDVPWDSLEFLHPQDFHLAGDDD